MSLIDCIAGKVASGKLTSEQGQEISELFREIRGETLSDLGDELTADVEAARKTAEAFKAGAQQFEYQGYLQTLRLDDVLKTSGAHKNGRGNGVQARLGPDIFGRQLDTTNIETTHTAILSDSQQFIADMIEQFRTKGLTGLKRDRAGEESM